MTDHSQLVKRLVWNEYDREDATEQWGAEAGTFHVYYGIELHHGGFRAFWDGELFGSFDTLNAAKAAAQADYTARILSAMNLDAIEALEAERNQANAALVADEGLCAKLILERDALQARVAELEAGSSEAPCRHEWYLGQCAHCEMKASTFRSRALLESQPATAACPVCKASDPTHYTRCQHPGCTDGRNWR